MNILYKCRLCEKTFTDSSGGYESVRDALLHVVTEGAIPWRRLIGLPPSLITIHHCENKNMGIADLIGAVEEE